MIQHSIFPLHYCHIIILYCRVQNPIISPLNNTLHPTSVDFTGNVSHILVRGISVSVLRERSTV